MRKFFILLGMAISVVILFFLFYRKPYDRQKCLNLTQTPAKYYQTTITASNLMGLLPDIPKELEQKIIIWAQKHQSLLDELISMPSIAEFKKEFAVIHQHESGDRSVKISIFQNKLDELEKAGFKNRSFYNFIFAIPETGYIAKIAGPTNKIWNILSYNGFPPGKPPKTDAEWDAIAKNIPKATYQTVSRAAFYLRYLEAEKTCDIPDINVLPIFLVHLPWRPTMLSDDNYIVIQKDIPKDFVSLVEHSEYVQYLSSDTMRQLIDATVVLDLWNTKSRTNIMVNKKGTLALWDLEQPNNGNPRMFFHKNRKKIEWDVAQGLIRIGGYTKGAPSYLKDSILELASRAGYHDHANRLYKELRRFIHENELLKQRSGYKELLHYYKPEALPKSS